MIRSLALLAALPTAFAFEYTKYVGAFCQGDLLDMQSRSVEDAKTACDANPECNAVSCANGQTTNCQLRSNVTTTRDSAYDCFLQTSNRTSPLGKELCVRMRVQAATHQQGYMYYRFTNNGTNVLQNGSNKFYDQGELVIETCVQGGMDQLTVQNTNNDGIGVDIEFSTDGGATYGGAHLDCEISDKSMLVVDNDGSGWPGCGCQSGDECTYNIIRKDRVDPTKRKCVKATIADYNYAAGYFSMSINSGSTVVHSFPSTYFKRLTTAVFQCYEEFTEVVMSSGNTDAAFVNLEFSVDGGANWDADIYCKNCGGTECTSSSGLFLVMDGDEGTVNQYHANFPSKSLDYCNCLDGMSGKECTIRYQSQFCTQSVVPELQFDYYWQDSAGRTHVDFNDEGLLQFSAKGSSEAGINIALVDSANLPTGDFTEENLTAYDVFIGGEIEHVAYVSTCAGCAPAEGTLVNLGANPVLVSAEFTDIWIKVTGTVVQVGSGVYDGTEGSMFLNVDTGAANPINVNRAIFTSGYGDVIC